MAADESHKEDISVFKNRLSENSIVLVQRNDPSDTERHRGILIGHIDDDQGADPSDDGQEETHGS